MSTHVLSNDRIASVEASAIDCFIFRLRPTTGFGGFVGEGVNVVEAGSERCEGDEVGVEVVEHGAHGVIGSLLDFDDEDVVVD